VALATARHNGPAAGPAAKGIDTRLSAAEALIWPLQFLTTQKGPGARAAGAACFLSAAQERGIWDPARAPGHAGSGRRAAHPPGVLRGGRLAPRPGRRPAALEEHQDLRQHDPVRRLSSLSLGEDGWESL